MKKIITTVSFIFCSIISNYGQVVPSFHWPLDGNAQAEIGTGGILFGGQPAADRFGNANGAIQFNGLSDYMELPDSTIYNRIPMSISVWIKPDGPGGLLGYQSWLYPQDPVHHVAALYVGTSGAMSGKFWDGTTSAMSGTNVDDGQWHHIMLTRDDVGQKLWVDGQISAERNIPTFDINMIYNYLGVCNTKSWPDSPGGYFYFLGKIDDLKFFDVALDSIQINDLLHQPLADSACIYCDDDNIALGYNAFNNDGRRNTIVGAGAAQHLSGSGNVIIGYQAGRDLIGSNRFVIGNNSETSLINGNFANGFIGLGVLQPEARLHLNGALRLDNQSPLLIDGSEGAGSRFSVLPNGQVAINTLNPGNYQLAVNGDIKSREITVDNNNWPDYVFKDNYKLLSLHDLQSYIKTNRHLPGVRSRGEIKQEGLEVGQMQAILLEKIEELTLYLIDLNLQVEVLKRENEALTTLIKR